MKSLQICSPIPDSLEMCIVGRSCLAGCGEPVSVPLMGLRMSEIGRAHV